jgi:hypothetical protein
MYSIKDNLIKFNSTFDGIINENIKAIIIDNEIEIIDFLSIKFDALNELNFIDNKINKINIHPNFSNIENIDKLFSKNNLPSDLEELIILDDIQKIKLNPEFLKNLPPKINKIELTSSEFIELNNLPNTLEILILNIRKVNITLDYLPSSLKILHLFDFTELGIDLYSLPPLLEEFILCSSKLNLNFDCLPANLKILKLPVYYYKKINTIPIFLQELKISLDFNFLEDFKICPNLKKLTIGFSNQNHTNKISNFDLTQIPETVEELGFGDNFNQKLIDLPKNLKKLTFGFNFKFYADNLPDSIEYLTFGYNFNNYVSKYPSGLKYLKFGRNFSQCIDNLPEGLVGLFVNERFHQPINKLPSTLEILEFNKLAEYNCDLLCIPDSALTNHIILYQNV